MDYSSLITASTTKTIFSTAASLAASAMVAQTILRDFMPSEFQTSISTRLRKLTNLLSGASRQTTMVIEELDGLVSNQIYEAAIIYLSSKISSSSAQRLRVSKPEKEDRISVTMDQNEEVLDVFDGVKLKWVLVCRTEVEQTISQQQNIVPKSTETRVLNLSFHRKNNEKVLSSYLPYILERAKCIKQENKTLKIFKIDPEGLFGNYANAWVSTKFDHPSTFETMAMDSELKKTIIEDLERFLKRKELYRKVGKAWKRGYLLYGPPGTGKSSLIAAMANYLKFDVYDMELSAMHDNMELRTVLLTMANRSILVVEDIDCTMMDFQNREGDQETNVQSHKKVTLSGMLNVMDGLWSSIGDERIIVFTTNHKEKLDPALLRPGRMDKHIHMSYCTPCGFEVLASNYLGMQKDGHSILIEEILQLISKVKVTPAQVAEELLKADDPEIVLQGLIRFLQKKMDGKDDE